MHYTWRSEQACTYILAILVLSVAPFFIFSSFFTSSWIVQWERRRNSMINRFVDNVYAWKLLHIYYTYCMSSRSAYHHVSYSCSWINLMIISIYLHYDSWICSTLLRDAYTAFLFLMLELNPWSFSIFLHSTIKLLFCVHTLVAISIICSFYINK